MDHLDHAALECLIEARSPIGSRHLCPSGLGGSMTPQEILTNQSISLASYQPGRYYTTCPKCLA
jgi:hypothetical protein